MRRRHPRSLQRRRLGHFRARLRERRASLRGNRLVTCDSDTKLTTAIDCCKYEPGWECRTVPFGPYMETDCYPTGPACNYYGEWCDGTTLVYCSGGAEVRVDCTQFAGTCGRVGGGNRTCIPTATECTSASPDRCSGNALEICVNGVYESTDCTTLGLTTCQTSSAPGPLAKCVP
jgi:hypothetical protein